MAGDAVIGASIQVVVQNVISISKKTISLFWNHKHELEKLKDSFSMVKAFLYEAEKKQVTNMAVRIWLRNLEALAFESYNVFDDIDYERLSEEVGATKKKSLKRKFQSLKESTSNNLGCRIKDINEKLKSINQQATDFGLQTIAAHALVSGPDAYEGVETNSFSVDPVFLGRENDVSTIVETLINTSSRADQQVLSVLPIVGMGGLGKTTLARKLFGNEKIISHFGNNRVWVYVSRNFDVRNILKNILTSLTVEKMEHESSEAILKKLQKHLGSKTYLLVLDDHWDGERDKWDSLVNSLLGISSGKGNCMIVTTRSEEVASIVKTLHVYKLNGISEDDSWSIIKAKAFINSGDIPMEFETIGRNIAERCKGLPLAAKVVGGLLRDKSKYEWLSIEKNWLLGIGDGNHISKILKLSFDHLSSPSLKKCFAYCSIFPKGHRIKKEQLIELWMAEGFLQTDHQRSNIDMETTGNNFFNLLLQNSLLQVEPLRSVYATRDYSMHDLVHDLSYSVLCENDDITEGVCNSRYIGYKPSGDGLLSIPKGQERYVRTLFFNGRVSNIKFSDFESLHTLTLVGDDIDDLPTTIKELKHLRYLDITETNIRSLPDSIGELYHLQTFRSQENIWKYQENIWKYQVENLPDSFSCLISLRHLHISPEMTILPSEIGKLTSLQTLPYFHVGGEKGCGISELGNLKNLKGKLNIHNLEKVRDKNEATSADLIRKSGIYEIKLVWDCSRVGDETNDESVLDGLQPHPNLMKLWIWGFKGKSLPPWTCKMAVEQLDGNCCWEGLNNLMEIKLEYCSECEELPMLGHLPRLKNLYLSGLRNVKSIGPSFYGIDNCGNTISNNGSICVVVFPALERLELVDMRNLKEWDDLQPSDEVVVVFPCLQYLEIKRCNQLTRAPSHFPCLNSLETLVIIGCPHLKSIPYYPSSRGGQQGLTSLKELHIQNCTGLHNLPTEMVESCASSLERLTLEGLSSLTNTSEVIGCLPKMTRLTNLEIKRVPMRMGPSYSSWNNVSFNEAFDAMLLQFTSLRELELSGMEHWDCLPDGLQHLHSLEKLNLRGFGIEALPDWFGNLSSLETLELQCCYKLRHFPSKQAMLRLSELTCLRIDRCPLLVKDKRSINNPFERQQIVDSEWHKISHLEKNINIVFNKSQEIPFGKRSSYKIQVSIFISHLVEEIPFERNKFICSCGV